MRLVMVAIGALWIASINPALSGDPQHPSTCLGYIGVMNAAAQSQDPLGPQAYLDLADKMYARMNKAVVEQQHLAPLPLPGEENSEGRRGMAVVAECQHDMSLKYFEAVTYAYIRMRKDLGLPIAGRNSRTAMPCARAIQAVSLALCPVNKGPLGERRSQKYTSMNGFAVPLVTIPN